VAGLPGFSTLIQYSSGIPRQSNETRACNKGRSQSVTICRGCKPTPKRCKKHYQKLLEFINSYRKVVVYKISIQKSLAFVYTNNAQTEKEIREAFTFTILSKTIKYLEINLMKENKDLFNENYKPLKREIEEDISR
jgi:hypothetical protein